MQKAVEEHFDESPRKFTNGLKNYTPTKEIQKQSRTWNRRIGMQQSPDFEYLHLTLGDQDNEITTGVQGIPLPNSLSAGAIVSGLRCVVSPLDNVSW